MIDNHLRKVAGGSALALALATYVSPASAQTTGELLRQIEILKSQVEALEQQVQKNTAETEQAKTQAAEAQKAVQTTDSNVVWKWGPSPTISSKDGRFSAHVRGRLFTDYNYITGTDQQTNNAELRAARIGIEGVAWKDVEYKLEVDFADSEVDVKDATISYKGVLAPFSVTLGQFKTPNSLEEQTSSRYITFMERAAFTDAFGLDRRIGIGGDVGGKQWKVSSGVFMQNTGIGTANGDGPDAFGAVAVRGHYGFDLGNGDAVHLGASYRFRNCSNDADSSGACNNGDVRYRQRPFFHATSIRHINTGTLSGMKSDHFFGPEFALVYGPFSLQSEAGFQWGSRRSQTTTGPTGGNFGPLWGAYGSASYFFTGEQRNYSKSSGKFGRVKVNDPVFNGGWGAWQIAGRFDYLSLEDVDNGVEGGEQWSYIGGLNWYLNNNVRMMFDIAYTQVTGGPQDVNDAEGNNGIFGFGVRGQVDW